MRHSCVDNFDLILSGRVVGGGPYGCGVNVNGI